MRVAIGGIMTVIKVGLAILGAAIILFAAIYLFKLKRQTPDKSAIFVANMERVEFKTKDNVAIVGDYYPPKEASRRGLLLLHMMPADRASWRTFAGKMQARNFHVLAIDLRGHGESQGGPDGYKNFSDSGHQASRRDVEAGVDFMRTRGVADIYLGGASIGANLSLQYLAEYAAAEAAFLLSPGIDYRGVKTEPAAKALREGQAVYYAASKDDSYSAETVRGLFAVTPPGAEKELKMFNSVGHGTAIFEREPEFMETIAAWLDRAPL